MGFCGNKTSDFIQQNAVKTRFSTSEAYVVLSPLEQSIKQKIEKVGTPLKDWDIQINYGIKTGYNDAFIISTKKRNEILANCKSADEKKRTEKLIRPILRGRDIKRYGYDWAGLWLVNTHNGVKEKGIPRIDIKDYPAVKKHLDEYWNKIKDRSDQGDTPYNLRNCAYLEDFGKPKIVWASVGETYYSLVKNGIILLDTNYFFPIEKPNYLIGVLNSKLITFWINSEDTQIGGGGAYRHYKYNLERLPIPKSSNFKSRIEQLVSQELKNPSAETEHEIDSLVYQLYGLSDDEIAFIENQ